MHSYAQAYGIAAGFAMEAGGRDARLHVQGLLRIRMETTTVASTALKKHIKQFIPIQRGSRGTVAAQPLSQGQSWDHMLGYIQKDSGLAHYRLLVHNISDEDLQRGRVAYAGVRDDPDEGRIAINKGNLPKLAVRLWRTHLKPLEVPLDHTLKFMLQSDMYIPTAQWVMSPYGRGMENDRAQALYEMLVDGAKNATILQVRRLFFQDDSRKPTDDLWDCTLEAVLLSARRAREGAGPNQDNTTGGTGMRTERLMNALRNAEEEFQQHLALQRGRQRLAREEYSSDDDVDIE